MRLKLLFQEIANALRDKTGISRPLQPLEFATLIENIETVFPDGYNIKIRSKIPDNSYKGLCFVIKIPCSESYSATVCLPVMSNSSGYLPSIQSFSPKEKIENLNIFPIKISYTQEDGLVVKDAFGIEIIPERVDILHYSNLEV